VVQGLGGELPAVQRLKGREQLFTPRSDANVVLVARSLAPAQYIQCTESTCRVTGFKKPAQGYKGKASAAPRAGDLLAYD
jgi:hypothetical protein